MPLAAWLGAALLLGAAAAAAAAAGAQAQSAPEAAPAVPPVLGALAAGAVAAVPGAGCRAQLAAVLTELVNLTDWAVQMADASGKLPSGLLRGNLRALGDVDACLSARPAAPPGMRPQYCLAQLELAPAGAAWARLLDTATAGRRGKEVLRGRELLGPAVSPVTSRMEVAVCAPAACSPADLAAGLGWAARRLGAGWGLRLGVRLEAADCQTEPGAGGRPLAAADCAVLAVLALTAVLAIAGSAYDLYWPQQESAADGAGGALLRAFSLPAGWQRLWSGRPSGAVGCADGVRALSTLWVVMTHKLVQMSQEPWVNKVRLIEALKDPAKMPLLNSMLNVDSFLLVSGMLRGYNVLGEAERGHFGYGASLLQRFLRLSPAYFLAVAFYATLLEYVGSGPAWRETVGRNVDNCRRNWLLNVLYVNNYLGFDSICMLQSWYLSADLQLFAAAPLVLLPLLRWRRAGRALLAALLAASVALPAATIALLRLPGVFLVGATDLDISNFLRHIYLATHNRMAPYLVGLGLGYLLHRLRDRKFSMARGAAAAGWAACLAALAAVMWGPYGMMQPEAPYNLTANILYGGLHRLAWALAVAWLVFACHMGYGGPVDRLLNSYALRTLSRLSYCVYLTHYAVLLFNSARVRTPIWMDEFLLMHNFIGDVSIIILVSMVLYLAFESPWFVILKMLFPKDGAEKKPKKVPSETNMTQVKTNAGEKQ